MIRNIFLILFCISVTACGGASGGDSQPDDGPAAGSSGDPMLLGPTAAILESPPVNDRLPADLIPPG